MTFSRCFSLVITQGSKKDSLRNFFIELRITPKRGDFREIVNSKYFCGRRIFFYPLYSVSAHTSPYSFWKFSLFLMETVATPTVVVEENMEIHFLLSGFLFFLVKRGID